MLDPVDVTAILVAAGLSIIVNRYLKRRTMLMVTPPGPACWPIIGNMFEISQTEPWKTYWAWSQIYKSSLISVRIPGQLMIVLNTAEAAQDLLSQRARNYSDKPRLAMMELEEWDWSTGLLPYGNRWQKHRRFLHQSLHQNALATFYPAQNLHLRRFALRLHSNPAQFRAHIRQFTAGLFISIAYDIDIAEDPYLAQLSEQAVEMMATSNFPGAQLLNAVPALRHLPAWFPGAGFKRFALKCRALTRKLRFEPLGVVKQAIANGSARPSVASALLERAGKSDLSEDDAAEIAGIIYAAGSDTLAAALTTVIAISALRPDIQRRARAQLDSVLGGMRLPDQSDRKSLLYIEAICREILRWHMITPLGLPHASIDDDWYEGMYIPGGTTIFLNAWAISRNPTVYPEPEVFRPERFLDEDGNLTDLEEHAVFGYGRRECVGKHLAMSTLFLAVAYLLTVFEFGKAKDEHGQDIDIREEFEGVLISYPVEFQCDIRPRDEQAVELLKTLDLADA